MDRERWRRIEPILERALDLDTEQRSAYLDEACGDDAELRTELETLILADRQSGELLDSDGDSLFAAVQPDLADAPLPDAIGPYRILDRLGQGGMGIVYRAVQPDPERTVALKVVRAGMDSDGVLARFQAERHALSLMDHPNIATVFDAGVTEGGLPYFVMEYVDGEPVTSFCDRAALSTSERIDLVETICDAIQHAHRKGIIHRDIKPSNILVTQKDGKPVPKVIDFGIAKATDQRLAERTAFTELGQIIGTPEYMSPEQADPEPADIDTRTDVYALGVLLYELLVGVLPFDPQDLRRAGYDEMRRILRETDPPRPSTRLRSLGSDVTDDVARQRKTDPSLLARNLEGELDWIVMRALEKERERRYGSAAALADDLARFRDHLPVLARPQSRGYRLRKFVRRNRAGVAVAGALAASILIAVAALAYGLVESDRQKQRAQDALVRAEHSRDQAEAVTSFLVDLMAAPNPGEQGRDITVREVLDDASEKIQEQLTDQPVVESRVRRTLGLTYRGLGLHDKALDQFERALQVREESFAHLPELKMIVLNDIAVLHRKAGRLTESEAAARQAIEIAVELHGEEHPRTLRHLANLASFIENMPGRAEEAEELYKRVAKVLRDQRPVGDPDRTMITSQLGIFYARQGRFDEAAPLLEESYESTRAQLGPEHPEVLIELNNLAGLHTMQKDYEEGERRFRELLEISKRVRGPEHMETITVQSNLAELCVLNGRPEEAVELSAEAVAVAERTLSPEHWRTAYFRKSYGVALGRVDRVDEGITQLRESHRVFLAQFGAEHPQTVDVVRVLDELTAGTN